jgi:hypothetical protein
MSAATPADPEVHARPQDVNAAGAIVPPTTTTPGDQSPDIYAPVASDADPETPARPVAQTVQEELGGHSGYGVVDNVEEGALTAPAQGGEETLAAPGTLPVGGDNIGVANDGRDHGGGRSLPVGNTQDPETPVRPGASLHYAPYLTSNVGQEPAGA